MPVLWTVLCSGSSSRRTPEGLFERGMSPGPQTSGPGNLVRQESGVLSGAISLRERMAGEKEGCGASVAEDDTRRDPPRKAFPEAHLTDPGGEGGNDTRQDRPEEAEPAHLCGLRIPLGGDTRQNGPSRGRILSWIISSFGGNHGIHSSRPGSTAL